MAFISSRSVPILLVTAVLAFCAALYIMSLSASNETLAASRAQVGLGSIRVEATSSAARYPETNWPIGSIPAGKRCSQRQTNFIWTKRGSSSCPQQRFYIAKISTELSKWRTGGSPITIINAGCNKGDSIVESMRVWSHNPSISTKSWYLKVAEKIGTGLAQGACGKRYTSDTKIPLGFDPRPIRAYCIEPAKSTADMLSALSEYLGYKELGLHVIRAAVGERLGKAYFPHVVPGDEVGGIHQERDDDNDEVDQITIDKLVESENLNVIDLLSIDTEGNDVPVLLGSIMTLATKTVRVIEFEYHNIGRWVYARLEELLDLLDNLGFDCYWQNANGDLLRLTGCYDEIMTEPDFKTWSNVFCVNRREKRLASFVESYAAGLGFGADL